MRDKAGYPLYIPQSIGTKINPNPNINHKARAGLKDFVILAATLMKKPFSFFRFDICAGVFYRSNTE